MSTPDKCMSDGPPAPEIKEGMTKQEIAKIVDLSDIFAGDVVKHWILQLIGGTPAPKIETLFPDGCLGGIAASRIQSPDGSINLELRLSVVAADHSPNWLSYPCHVEIGQQITYLLTMARTYLQFATQHYKSLRDHAWLYDQLIPSAHATMYSLSHPDGPHIGVTITDVAAPSIA
jgi:hypothetical protein